MKRVSMPCSVVMTLALAAFPAGLRAQSGNLLATKTINASIGSLNANSEATETQGGKYIRASAQVVEKSWNVSSILTGAPRPKWKSWTIAGFGSPLPDAAVKPWSGLRIPTETLHPNRKNWTIAAPGSLPLAVAIQPDATQKYSTNPAILEVHFGHRP